MTKGLAQREATCHGQQDDHHSHSQGLRLFGETAFREGVDQEENQVGEPRDASADFQKPSPGKTEGVQKFVL